VQIFGLKKFSLDLALTLAVTETTPLILHRSSMKVTQRIGKVGVKN